jgi:WD40 repeat protein
MKRCPARDRWELFLADHLDEAARGDLERHAEACAACQQMLEALTDVPDWDGRNRPVTAAIAAQRHAEFLRRLQETPPGQGAPMSAPRDGTGVTPAAEAARTAAGPCGRGAAPAIPGYEILGELGRGGMGVVYQARQLQLDRPCALKMILAGAHADRESAARFLAEARAIARLEHPHIVQIHHIGEADGLPFLELEYLPGGGLDRQLDGTPWPPRRAARLIEQLAAAMAAAHRLGVVHRDLKPANVLLAADGAPKIADFGLAKMLGSESALTRTDLVMGSPSYMAPEQAGGQARQAGPAADVYALGAILYQLLTGGPPFRGATALETLEQVKGSEPVAPSRLVPRLPRDIETICLKCLPKEPSRRYPGASDLAEDLRRYLDGRAILARRGGPVGRAWRWCRRNRAVAGLLASVCGLVMAIAIILAVSAARLGVETRRAQGAESGALRRLFHASFAQAKAIRGSGRMGQRHDTLSALAEAAALNGRVAVSAREILDMRTEAIAAMALPDIRLGHEWEPSSGAWNGYTFDSTYERYALSNKDGEVTVRSVADDRVLRRFVIIPPEGPNEGVWLHFSPGDRYLAAYYVDSVNRPTFVWDLDDPQGRPLLAVSDASTDWSFDESRRIAVVGTRDRRVRRFDLSTGHERAALDVGIAPSAVSVHPQGRVLAVAAIVPPVVRLFDLDSGQLWNSLWHAPAEDLPRQHAAGGVSGLAWHPDGEFLATACTDHKVYVWDWVAGRKRRVLTGHTWEVADVAYSHWGDLLASQGHDKTVRLWDHRTGALLLTIPASSGVSFSRDDRIFFAQARGTRWALCGLEMPAEFRLLDGHPRHHQVCDVCFHPQGRLLATASDGDGIRLWDLITGRQIAHLSAVPTRGILFEKDGTGLLAHQASQLWRWPLEFSSGAGRQRLHIGPPQCLLTIKGANPSGHMTFCGPDQDRLAITDFDRGVDLIELSPRPRAGRSWRTPTAHFIAASPDGRWVATGSFEGPGFQVWDTLRNAEARSWSTGDADVTFSPDGRWLVSGCGDSASAAGGECCFWKVGTWERGPSIPLERTAAPSQSAFSDDGLMFVVLRTMTEILVLDPRDLRELARLQSREPMLLNFMRFSPDGGLLVAGTAAGYVHVWDLRRIRARLEKMHLDWDLPPIGPPPGPSSSAGPLEVDLRLDRDSLVERAIYDLELPDYRRAVADLEEALALDPDRADVRRRLVGVLTNGPPAVRDLGRASDLVRATPGRATANLEDHGDLGMILYRQSHYAEAIEPLQKAISGHTDPLERARWRIILAMSQFHVGQARAADDSYRQARSEFADAKPSPSAAEEFTRLWSEADATLHAGDASR